MGVGGKSGENRVFLVRFGREAGVNDAREMTICGPRRYHATQSDVGPGK
jgi:hypothetical protein